MPEIEKNIKRKPLIQNVMFVEFCIHTLNRSLRPRKKLLSDEILKRQPSYISIGRTHG